MSNVRYARFWKCALQVNPWDYAVKYRGCDHGLDEAGYNAELLRLCQAEKIRVVGIADHGNVSTLDALRQVLVEGGITVFPGFEMASSEKAHFVSIGTVLSEVPHEAVQKHRPRQVTAASLWE